MYVCILSTFSNIFSSEINGPIEAKFHVGPPWDGGTKLCSNGPIEAKFHVEPPWDGETKLCSKGPGYITKMAAMPIYSKNLKENLLLRNQKADDLETWFAGLQHRVLEYYQFCSNDDPGLILAYFTALMLSYGKR